MMQINEEPMAEKKMAMTELKVNLHIVEACNMHCEFCFAKFQCMKALTLEDWKHIVDNIADETIKGGTMMNGNLIGQKVTEINIAGGEPTLWPHLIELAQYICSKGLKVSLIHNGSASLELYHKIAPYLTTCGFSIDSVEPDLQRRMGRCFKDGQVITSEEYEEKINTLRSVNPDIKIKVNTVVNSVNLEDDLTQQIHKWGVDRWKFLHCMPFSDGVHDNSHMVISDEEYTTYMHRLLSQFDTEYTPDQYRYKIGDTVVVAERTLAGSYIMVDSNGYLVDDTKNTSYTKVADLRKDDFREGLSRLTLFEELYRLRY